MSKAKKILGLISRSFTYHDEGTIIALYKSLVRPLLEYGHVISFPSYKKDSELLERVQRRATKMVPALKNIFFEERLRKLNLPSLYYRRERGDMVECHKVTHWHYDMQTMLNFENRPGLRGHSLKFKKEFTRTSVRKHFFTERVINLWNSLPDDLVVAPNLDIFKNRLDLVWSEYHYMLYPGSKLVDFVKRKHQVCSGMIKYNSQ